MAIITKNTDKVKEFDFGEDYAKFALSIVVLRERFRSLSREDHNDLYELLPALLGEDEEERLAAERAVKEIFDQASGKMKKMDLPSGPGESLDSWVGFVSRRIREARADAQMTQEQLALKSGLPQSHISRLESGEHSPTAKTLEKIAQATGRDVSFFDPSEPFSI